MFGELYWMKRYCLNLYNIIRSRLQMQNKMNPLVARTPSVNYLGQCPVFEILGSPQPPKQPLRVFRSGQSIVKSNKHHNGREKVVANSISLSSSTTDICKRFATNFLSHSMLDKGRVQSHKCSILFRGVLKISHNSAEIFVTGHQQFQAPLRLINICESPCLHNDPLHGHNCSLLVII